MQELDDEGNMQVWVEVLVCPRGTRISEQGPHDLQVQVESVHPVPREGLLRIRAKVSVCPRPEGIRRDPFQLPQIQTHLIHLRGGLNPHQGGDLPTGGI